MKNSLNNRRYLSAWYTVPGLLLTVVVISLVAEQVLDALARKEVKNWYKDLIERGKEN